MQIRLFVVLGVFSSVLAGSSVAAVPQTAPPAGLRENAPAVHALVNARIVVAPGQTIERGTLVVRDGLIAGVGPNVAPPADAQVWECEGKTLYAGFIDGYSELAVSASTAGAPYWNSNVVPESNAARHYVSNETENKKLRGQGIVARLVAPSEGIIKGTSALVTTGDDAGQQAILAENVALHLKVTVGRGRGRGNYPNSPMGATALVRQAFYDAGWHRDAWAAYEADSLLPRPERNDALDVLQHFLSGRGVVVIDAADELYALRADRVAREFDLDAVLRGSGYEYRRLDEVKATGRTVIVPLNFPRPPNVATPEAALNVSLERLMHWDHAPENAARLAGAGVTIVFTTDGMSDAGKFLGAVRQAVERGLEADAALAALTTAPANLFGAERRLGTLATGKSANIVVTDGDLFAKKTKIVETWVDGRRYEIVGQPELDARGTWDVEFALSNGQTAAAKIELGGTPEKLKGKLTLRDKSSDLVQPNVAAGQFTASVKGKPLGWDGVVQLSATISTGATAAGAEAQQTAWLGSIVWADGASTRLAGKRTAGPGEKGDEAGKPEDESAEQEKKPVDGAEGDRPAVDEAPADDKPPMEEGGEKQAAQNEQSSDESREEEKPESEQKPPRRALFPVNYPLGAFGRAATPEPPAALVFRNATVWTSGPQGVLENAAVLVENGRIAAVGRDLRIPVNAVIVECGGKHVTPGIIDCHSHIATDGGVNESGQTITAEVRIGDFVDCNDINIYRQLAGGVTSSNILHGSANTIGGQNQVLKFRWGATPEEMKFAAAPQGIKFALGENVKQANWGNEFNSRYPQTRMGVEQLVRDAFQAARDYRSRWDKWKRTRTGLPPRVDLELEALAEVVHGDRLVHCHSYRQDEILALMRTCEEFGVRLATLQHILEGYKVADVMARHGVGGSSFADWWAYKFEVIDAIPYNGALLHNAGVVVSFNSDDAEMARRLNLEAAKAVKYGGVEAAEALKFVTLNPAKQLGIDKRVGSLEAGKDADLVVWSGSPLSSYSRCEQTWIDGRRYFDLDDDQQQRGEARRMHAALVQRVLDSGEESAGPDDDRRDRWPREDLFCHGHDHDHGAMHMHEEADHSHEERH